MQRVQAMQFVQCNRTTSFGLVIIISLIKECHLYIHIMFLTGVGTAAFSKVSNGLKIGRNLDEVVAFKLSLKLALQ